MKGLRGLAKAAKAAGVPRQVIERFLSVGYVPQPRQLDFHASALDLRWGPDLSTPIYLGLGGARGGGKTTATLHQLCLDASTYPGLSALLLRRTGSALTETLTKFAPSLRAWGATATRTGLAFPNGSFVTIGHFRNASDIDRHLGQSRDVIAVEEATTLTLSKFRALDTTVRGNRRDYRPRMYLTTNPGGVGHQWYRDLFVKGVRPDGVAGYYRHIQATVDDNHAARAADPAYIARLDALTGWELDAYRFGSWDIAAGAFFRDRPTVAKPPDMREPFVVFGLDYGWSHPAAAYRIAYDWDTQTAWVTHELHASRTMVAGLAAWLRGLGCHEVHAGADVRTRRDDLSIADRIEAEGIRVTNASQDRMAGASLIAEWLAHGRVGIAPECVHLIEQLERLEANPARPGDVLKADADPETGGGGDDAYDAFRYGMMALAYVAGGRDLRAGPRRATMADGGSTIFGGLH